MKFALIGTGKLGREIVRGHGEDRFIGLFNDRLPPTPAALNCADVVLIFSPKDSLSSLSSVLEKINVPVVCGIAGCDLPLSFRQQLVHRKQKWICSSNFSPGMGLLKPLIQILNRAETIMHQSTFTINETNYSQMSSGPSQTALLFEEWLGEKTDIYSERIANCAGKHEIELKSGSERIRLEHSLMDYTAYLKGIDWSINKLLFDAHLGFGWHDYTNLLIEEVFSHGREELTAVSSQWA